MDMHIQLLIQNCLKKSRSPYIFTEKFSEEFESIGVKIQEFPWKYSELKNQKIWYFKFFFILFSYFVLEYVKFEIFSRYYIRTVAIHFRKLILFFDCNFKNMVQILC